LQQEEQAEVLAELVGRVAGTSHDPPDAEDLVAAADQPFVEFDRLEQRR
jgi:hypothetical protein